jgi:hypothetical protein
MTEQKQITLEEALELFDFEYIDEGEWRVKQVKPNVRGDGQINVWGTINGRKWEFVETPREKLKRLIEEGADKAQLLEAFNQLEDNMWLNGADWQLEQVIEWMRDNLQDHRYSGIGIDVDYVIEDLREAMRPTTQEDLEDVQLVLERMNSIPEPITLEELMTLDDTTQEDN